MRWLPLALLLLIPICAASAQEPGAGVVPTWNQGIGFLAVTPSDTTPLAPPAGLPPTALPKAIFNGNGATECNIAVKSRAPGALAVTLDNIQPGEVLPIAPAYVMATNTTCANVAAIY